MSSKELLVIKLGHYVQDDSGTQWLVTQQVRHYKSPDKLRLVLVERCFKDHRTAMCLKDGTEFACKDSVATKILTIVE